jgi:hypothetical protein
VILDIANAIAFTQSKIEIDWRAALAIDILRAV